MPEKSFTIKELYFETKDHDIITGSSLRNMIFTIHGEDGDTSNMGIRAFAEECKRIEKEVDYPSFESLVKHHHTMTAMILYYKLHPGISITEAKDYVYGLGKDLK